MSKPKHWEPLERRRFDLPGWSRRAVIGLSMILGVAILASALVLQREGGTSPVAESGPSALNGRWLRPDGGYVLEIRGAGSGGSIEAMYLNSRPIEVARVEVAQAGSAPEVIVELRAPGNPGSTYTLRYDPKRDQLAGIYFQAASAEAFDVAFTRMR